MGGGGFEGEWCVGVGWGEMGVMGGEAGVNGVYGNKIGELRGEERG